MIHRPGEVEELKRRAAEQAAALVESGMVVGLGFGSTAVYAVRRIAVRLAEGELQDILGIPTTRSVEAEASALGIPLTTLEAHPRIDLTLDGADEVDPRLDVIKGGGGALLREKIVAQASQRLIIVVDERKLSSRLGSRAALPVEVLPFGWGSQVAYLESLGAEVTRRSLPDGSLFTTDQGNWILDCQFGPMQDPAALAAALQARAGILEHGLFLGLATEVMVAGAGGVRRLTRKD
ncbi:MAG TPA: ribose-5-phosphate isomerase RpiA [Anaerolineales bacterium]|nr:ribose-5-phosphate isomerase RpiA [Anaerolineales bacterium]